jgi:hypothetical protein
VEFSDFQCRPQPRPRHRGGGAQLRRQGELVYRQMPLTAPQRDEGGRGVALRARAGEVLEYHDTLFRISGPAADKRAEARAAGRGRWQTTPAWTATRRTRWKTDMKDGEGVAWAPAFFINGVFLQRRGAIDEFREVIDSGWPARGPGPPGPAGGGGGRAAPAGPGLCRRCRRAGSLRWGSSPFVEHGPRAVSPSALGASVPGPQADIPNTVERRRAPRRWGQPAPPSTPRAGRHVARGAGRGRGRARRPGPAAAPAGGHRPHLAFGRGREALLPRRPRTCSASDAAAGGGAAARGGAAVAAPRRGGLLCTPGIRPAPGGGGPGARGDAAVRGGGGRGPAVVGRPIAADPAAAAEGDLPRDRRRRAITVVLTRTSARPSSQAPRGNSPERVDMACEGGGVLAWRRGGRTPQVMGGAASR